ncbi:MAG: Spy/CpxP family protein refolding chaperone [Microcoleaceae cyanobacterium]
MLRYWSLIFAAIILTLNVPKLASANPTEGIFYELSQRNNLRQEDPNSPPIGLFDQLDVTPQQKQEIQEIRDQHRVTLEKQQRQLAEVQRELNQLIASEAPKEQIRQKHEKLLKMTEDMRELNLDVMLQLRDILTPQQRARFAEIMQNRRITPIRNP